MFDLVGGWATSAPTTLINKFMMAFVCGAIAWSGKSEGKKLPRVITGAVCGSLTYCALYLLKSFIETRLEGNSAEAAAILLGTKAVATIVNAVIADVVAVPSFPSAFAARSNRTACILASWRLPHSSWPAMICAG